MILSASKHQFSNINWELLIKAALCTGMRRGELLNTTWQDIDFERKTIDVSPKMDTEHTWEWHIKDTDRRTLPITDQLVQFFARHQAEQPEGYPYVFIPSTRYNYIQQLRKKGKWDVERGKNPLNNFDRSFKGLRKKTGIVKGTFHDLRRTCITSWFANGLREYDVMVMAGHSSFETTRQFYLAIRDDLLDLTRLASSKAMESISVAKVLQTPSGAQNEKGCLS